MRDVLQWMPGREIIHLFVWLFSVAFIVDAWLTMSVFIYVQLFQWHSLWLLDSL